MEKNHEYEKMARAEKELWWYQALHHLVFDSIHKNLFGWNVSIIDAGCGTGGLMLFLHERGFGNLKGFDLSPYAVKICRERRLDVEQGNLINIAGYYPPASADVIVSNDTLYYLNEQQRSDVVRQCFQLLKPEGLLMFNLPALKAFQGIHDVAVGIIHRFSRPDVPELIDPSQFCIIRELYWPFLLSPAIYLVRLRQRIRMRMKSAFEVNSDIDLPSPPLNKMLRRITLFENRWFRTKPFGSSLFLVMKKKNQQMSLKPVYNNQET